MQRRWRFFHFPEYSTQSPEPRSLARAHAAPPSTDGGGLLEANPEVLIALGARPVSSSADVAQQCLCGLILES